MSDFGSLERQVAIQRGEIERIEAERSASRSRVSFANVFFALQEERTSTAETIGAKLRSAAIGGLNDALGSLSSILLFTAGHGPLLVFVGGAHLFPGALLLAPPFTVGLQRGPSSQVTWGTAACPRALC